ncbi:MAG: phenylalanine--tRNA ligase subunit alpha [Bacillota bacterium]
MRQEIETILAEARARVAGVREPGEVRDLRTHYLGRKGQLTLALRSMGSVPAEERPLLGRLANEAKAELERLLDQRLEEALKRETAAHLERERIDVTLPGYPVGPGAPHVLVQAMRELEDIFTGMGFAIAEGPEVETDEYNFVALNIHKWHPARDMQATFYTAPDQVLRTHTSPVQIRAMLEQAPRLPLRVIAPGRVYRRDPADASHLPAFTQLEGLAVDVDVTMGDLRGVLLEFVRQFFGPDTKIRLRPSYFPFTEPSAEVDVSCTVCGGSGCRVCAGSGWLEAGGSGMVHPQVLANGGYDPAAVTGFAFGMGVERMTMLKYGIDDIRLFLQNDLRFLGQFRSM